MGQSLEFNCVGCGYSATVSGGDSQGMLAKTTTIVCKDCRKLYDVVTGKLEEGFADIPPHCPRAKKHAIERWTSPGLCPKCGGPMIMGDVGIDWD